MSTTTEHRILEAIAKTIDIPDSAYDAAGRRYRDLGVWFAHPGSFAPASTRTSTLRDRFA